MNDIQRKRRATILRLARKVHRLTGASLFAFFLVVAVTGLLLGWKKNSGELILADSRQGRSIDPKDWLPLNELQEKAVAHARKHISPDISDRIDRIDVRPDKGMAKFLFVEGYWGLQIDCTTGELLSVERRYSDIIENIHDGTIVDAFLGIKSGSFKLLYTSVLGFALFTFTVTGFWLWIGPKEFRSKRHKK